MSDRSGLTGLRRTAAGVFLALAPLVGCGRAQTFDMGDFVGKWQSSRLSMPIYLDEHGGWEIRDDAGDALQYGVWTCRDGAIEWVFKSPSGIQRDVNSILSANAEEFVLREQNGNLTTFRRIR
ncbi:MAG: hypothetical protein AB1642_08045 [Pseudomonadota bacterium]